MSVERVLVSDVANHVGEEVRVTGWVHNRRDLGGVRFLHLRECFCSWCSC